MNSTDGYWVAAHAPKAAEEALTGTMPLTRIRAVALLTDGAARPVDDFHEMTWREAMEYLETDGPQGLIHRTRAMETATRKPSAGHGASATTTRQPFWSG